MLDIHKTRTCQESGVTGCTDKARFSRVSQEMSISFVSSLQEVKMGPGEMSPKRLFLSVFWVAAEECLLVCLLKVMPTVVSLW